MAENVLDFTDVTVVREGRTILGPLTWQVDAAERWVVLGPNGAGKSTLLQIAATLLHPSHGEARILGRLLGRSDVFELRPRVGLASTAMARLIPGGETVLDAVMTAAYAVLGRWNEQYEALDEQRARQVLAEWRLDHLAERRFGTLSDGEQKRVQIARATMTDPELLLLDEPAASLDLGAREELVELLSAYATSPASPAIVMVTHHVEEIPAGFGHALLLRDAAPVAAGPIRETITSALLSETFARPLSVTADGERFAARGA